ncbi:MAG: DUF6088 family protein [Ignavibacteria bacterium]|nr:DUF6088 family protein [Ignavibacteria bacterium]
MKVTELLRDKIERFPEGFVFTYDEFGIDADKENAFKKAMSRLVKSGTIERLSKGRFYKPKKGIINNLRPDEYEIVKDLLFEDRKPVGYITGLGIFNRLGLTTQMSNIIQIGAPFDKKQLQRSKYTIKFIRQWNNITRNNIYYLQLLDSIRFIKNIPDTTVNQSFDRLVFLVGELPEKELTTLTELALKYPPSVRAMTGAILEKLKYNNLSDRLLKSLKSTTNFNVDISGERIKDKQKWKIQ